MLKDMNFRFSRSCRKHSKHSHGSWILRAAGPAQPRGGGHPGRGDQHQPSVFTRARRICFPSMGIPGGQIPMGPLFWQSIKGKDPRFYTIPQSLVGKLQNCILYFFSFNVKSRTPMITLHIGQDNMNCHWWKLRSEIQGIAPPSQRNNKQFDPGAKSHVAQDTNYVRYLLIESKAYFQNTTNL